CRLPALFVAACQDSKAAGAAREIADSEPAPEPGAAGPVVVSSSLLPDITPRLRPDLREPTSNSRSSVMAQAPRRKGVREIFSIDSRQERARAEAWARAGARAWGGGGAGARVRGLARVWVRAWARGRAGRGARGGEAAVAIRRGSRTLRARSR